MTTYVCFRCGPMTLFLDADAVLAVTDTVTANGQGEGHGIGEWEGRALQIVNLNHLLEQPGGDQQALVLTAESTGGDPLMLGVDQIDTVLSLPSSEFRALPPLRGTLTEFFDAARPLPGGRLLGLRLRFPLPAALRAH